MGKSERKFSCFKENKKGAESDPQFTDFLKSGDNETPHQKQNLLPSQDLISEVSKVTLKHE